MAREVTILTQVEGAEPVEERVVLPESAPHHNEGKTLAAWVLMWVCSIGVLIAAVGMVLDLLWLLFAGIGVVILGFVVSAVLRSVGHGQPRAPREADPGL